MMMIMKMMMSRCQTFSPPRRCCCYHCWHRFFLSSSFSSSSSSSHPSLTDAPFHSHFSFVLFVADCIVPVDPTTVANTICQPIVGSMTAEVATNLGMNPSTEEALRDGVLQVVKTGCDDDIYVSGNIRKVSFVGTRVANPTTDPNAAGLSNDDEGGDDGGGSLGTLGVAFLSVGGVLLCLLLLLLFVRRRREDEEERGVLFVEAEEPEVREIVPGQETDDDIYTSGPTPTSDDDNWHHRSQGWGSPVVRGPGGINAPGSLAAMDTLALKPSPTSTESKTVAGGTPARITPNRNLPDMDQADPPKTPDTRGVTYTENAYVTPKTTRKVPPTMDQDGGDDAMVSGVPSPGGGSGRVLIMDDLMAETDIIQHDEADDDSVTKLVRIG